LVWRLGQLLGELMGIDPILVNAITAVSELSHWPAAPLSSSQILEWIVRLGLNQRRNGPHTMPVRTGDNELDAVPCRS